MNPPNLFHASSNPFVLPSFMTATRYIVRFRFLMMKRKLADATSRHVVRGTHSFTHPFLVCSSRTGKLMATFIPGTCVNEIVWLHELYAWSCNRSVNIITSCTSLSLFPISTTHSCVFTFPNPLDWGYEFTLCCFIRCSGHTHPSNDQDNLIVRETWSVRGVTGCARVPLTSGTLLDDSIWSEEVSEQILAHQINPSERSLLDRIMGQSWYN